MYSETIWATQPLISKLRFYSSLPVTATIISVKMSAFDASKESILQNLNSGVDFSFKGSVDAPIVELVHFLNSLQDYFTTSSCSGRVSVFRSGLTAKQIRWILVKHRLFLKNEILDAIQSIDLEDKDFVDSLVTLKCEAFILHINCRDLESAKSLHNIATLCGFRESGIKLGNKKIILAVRTTANGMELPIAKGSELIVSQSYLDLIINECNVRLASNFSRIDKFLTELKKHYSWPMLQQVQSNTSDNNLCRWGHTCSTEEISNKKGDPLSCIVGGYGAGKDAKSQRGLTSATLKADHFHPLDFVEDSMHAASAMLTFKSNSLEEKGAQYLVLSGGRISPAFALPCLRIHNIDQSYADVPYTTVGTEPDPRWGHSLTLILANPTRSSYLLYGGRDSHYVLNGAFKLHIELTATGIVCTWEKLSLSREKGASSLQLNRFFHAACATLNVFPVDDSQNNEYNLVVVHGEERRARRSAGWRGA